jgi:hypothetical protein
MVIGDLYELNTILQNAVLFGRNERIEGLTEGDNDFTPNVVRLEEFSARHTTDCKNG